MGSAYAQSNLPACSSGNFHNCYGSWTSPEGHKYIGEWKDYKYSGQGAFTLPSGNKYVGEFKDHKYNGQGTYTFGSGPWSGDKFVGEFKDGERTGQGTYTFANGNKYVGEWKDDERNGQGTYTWPDGDKYVGEYKNDKRNGPGTFTFANGNKYVGEYKDNKYNGQGILYLANGSISQSGIWSDDKLVTPQYVDPNRFTRTAKGNSVPACPATGYFHNCLGIFTSANGNKYVGEYRDNKFNGQGTFTFAGGNKYVGEFKDGDFNGQGTFTWTNGDKYVGEYKNDKRNGQGTYTYASGNKYVGEFKDGDYNGQGILYQANGSISQSGIWSDDKLVTSQYVDPDRFTRIAKGNSAPSAAEAQRLENERKAAQLEEDRKRLELEKRQIALERQRIESQKVQPQIAPDNRRRLALVIGNDNYSSMPVLTNAVNDSNSMNDALRQANFEVMHYKNLNKRGMEEALYNFTQKLGKDDVGMFYFAGHGAQANSKNFLIPVAENVKKSADVQFEGIDVNRVMAYLQDSKNSLNIVVLDACRSSLPERGGMSRGLTVTEAPQGSIVAYATAPGKAASDGDVGNSPFTKNLVRVMQRKGLKIEDVFKEVRVAVSRETNGEQVPQEVSQLVGDFYFRP